MLNSLVSIIIPSYNSEKYIYECVKSIIEQSYSNLEIIIVDDGSTDSSYKICEELGFSDNRIKLLHQKNMGVSSARNRGIKNSKGDYIIFVDSDDFVDLDFVESLLKLKKEYDCDLPIAGIRTFENYKTKFTSLITNGCFDFRNNEERFCELFDSILFFSPFNKLYDAKIIKEYKLKFSEEFNYGEDLLFNLSYLDYINSIGFKSSKSNLYNYRIEDSNSLSRKYNSNLYFNEKKLSDAILNFLKKNNLNFPKLQKKVNLRLFDCAYNNICTQVGHEKFSNMLFKTNQILNDDYMVNNYDYTITKEYSSIIVYLMKNKQTLLLVLYLIIKSYLSTR